MKIDRNDIDELIGKCLAGEASTEEQGFLDAWLKEDPDHQSYYNGLKTIFDKAAAVKTWQSFDTDAAWVKVQSQLNKKKGKVVSLQNYWQIARIAAGILLVIASGYVLFRWSRNDAPVQTMAVKSDTQVTRDTLPDGSRAVLNKKSSIAYAYSPKTHQRKVKLEGEAYFEVQHQEEKPFIIETSEVIIEDIGTTFNVMAFPESPTIEVFVETGEVAFYTLENPGLKLKEGETGVYHRASRSFARMVKADTNLLAYKTGVFNFHNTDLATMVHDLNEVYDVKLRLANDKIGACRLNVTFKNEKIESIADIIAETLNLTITKGENEIILDGNGCGEQ